jgi:hypothetical protein
MRVDFAGVLVVPDLLGEFEGTLEVSHALLVIL